MAITYQEQDLCQQGTNKSHLGISLSLIKHKNCVLKKKFTTQ